jgi:hypothetical protein
VAEKYRIDSGGKVDKNIWPPIVEGIYAKGSLFDKTSGKRLPRNANVEVGKEYLLITKRNFYGNSYRDIEIRRTNQIDNYFIYTVKATALSRLAANFFLELGARLTDTPAELSQIYPFVLRGSHIILHESIKIWFHKTDGFVDTFPSGDAKAQNQTIFAIRGETQKILSLSRFEGRTSVLRFMVLRRDSMGFRDAISRVQQIGVCVVDCNGIEFGDGLFPNLPKDRELLVAAEYDGYIDVVGVTSKFVTKRLSLKNGEKTRVTVSFNNKYRIFQGLDCVREIVFMREQKSSIISDEQMLMMLKRFSLRKIPIQHTFGAIATKMENLPMSRLWVMKQIRQGQIDKSAKEYLIKQLEGR